MEEDPLADDPNLYSYGFNSPLNYIDPTGMAASGWNSLFKFEGVSFDGAGGLRAIIGMISPEAGMVLSVGSAFVGNTDGKKKTDKLPSSKTPETTDSAGNVITIGSVQLPEYGLTIDDLELTEEQLQTKVNALYPGYKVEKLEDGRVKFTTDSPANEELYIGNLKLNGESITVGVSEIKNKKDEVIGTHYSVIIEDRLHLISGNLGSKKLENVKDTGGNTLKKNKGNIKYFENRSGTTNNEITMSLELSVFNNGKVKGKVNFTAALMPGLFVDSLIRTDGIVSYRPKEIHESGIFRQNSRSHTFKFNTTVDTTKKNRVHIQAKRWQPGNNINMFPDEAVIGIGLEF